MTERMPQSVKNGQKIENSKNRREKKDTTCLLFVYLLYSMSSDIQDKRGQAFSFDSIEQPDTVHRDTGGNT